MISWCLQVTVKELSLLPLWHQVPIISPTGLVLSAHYQLHRLGIECPLSAPPAWLSIDRSFLTPPWPRSSLTIIRSLFYFFSCCACWVPTSHRCTSSAITSCCSWNTRTWWEVGSHLERAPKQVGTLSRDSKVVTDCGTKPRKMTSSMLVRQVTKVETPVSRPRESHGQLIHS